MTDGVSDSEVVDHVLAVTRQLLDETGARPDLPEGGVHDDEVAIKTGYDLGIVQAALLSLAPDRLQLKPRGEGSWTVVGVDPSAE